mmetsp:Transcript_80998/g.196526  ORF Transcript_80998/g.196526 Transcript_80998/m.196526 type:complete len:100 (+) Transcript_80998:113-412(+)
MGRRRQRRRERRRQRHLAAGASDPATESAVFRVHVLPAVLHRADSPVPGRELRPVAPDRPRWPPTLSCNPAMISASDGGWPTSSCGHLYAAPSIPPERT